MIPFYASKPLTLGVELEIQIINPEGNDLSAVAPGVLENLKHGESKKYFCSEVTRSMLEINSGIHENAQALFSELYGVRDELLVKTEEMGIFFSGGGTHPFQLWNERQLYPKPRSKDADQKYGYLAKMFTIFGMHIHLGCANSEDALYLMHALTHYVPHLIALSVSSPFCQGVDTGFCSSRSNIANLFPFHGAPPPLLDWQSFSEYFSKMLAIPPVEGMKDIYWDIRPRADFGTIEIRVFDMPLTIERAARIAAFTQALALCLMEERAPLFLDDKYHLYSYNRFQASKLGLEAKLLHPKTLEEYSLLGDLLRVCEKIMPHAKTLGSEGLLIAFREEIALKQSDATWLRKLFMDGKSLEEIVALSGQLWAGKMT